MAGANRHLDQNNIPHREPLDHLNPLHEWVHKKKKRRIDLKSLVTEVRMSPTATKENVEEVWWWVKNKNLPGNRKDAPPAVWPVVTVQVHRHARIVYRSALSLCVLLVDALE